MREQDDPCALGGSSVNVDRLAPALASVTRPFSVGNVEVDAQQHALCPLRRTLEVRNVFTWPQFPVRPSLLYPRYRAPIMSRSLRVRARFRARRDQEVPVKSIFFDIATALSASGFEKPHAVSDHSSRARGGRLHLVSPPPPPPGSGGRGGVRGRVEVDGYVGRGGVPRRPLDCCSEARFIASLMPAPRSAPLGDELEISHRTVGVGRASKRRRLTLELRQHQPDRFSHTVEVVNHRLARGAAA